MTDDGRVHPACPNASNPYHECGISCLEKITGGQRRKDKKKPGFFLETSLSFGRKKKGSDSRPASPQVGPTRSKKKESKTLPISPQVIANSKPVNPMDTFAPRSPIPAKKKVESDHSQSSSSSHQNYEESFSKDHSSDKGQITSTDIVPVSGNLKPNGPKSLPLGSFTCFAIARPETMLDNNGKLDTSPDGPTVGSLNFTFSGISRATEDSDSEEVNSVVSDSCVSVGKYRVKANTASTLRLILDKYGDIAANCKLESASLRGYYLECLCYVVQELQSTLFNQLTKSKLKEFLAIIKDVESVQIDVSWQRDILDELKVGVEINNEQQATEEAKANCNDRIESTKKELEFMMEDLAEKEKAVVEAKARINETEARLIELELESARLSESISSLSSKVEKFQSKPLAQQIL